MFNFPELADSRERMLEAFHAEQERTDLPPYRPEGMTPVGEAAFPATVEASLKTGNEMTLANDLDFAPYWTAAQTGAPPARSAKRIAGHEFNTWYVRGLALRLVDEGATECQVFAADTTSECPECAHMDGKTLDLAAVIAGHRIRYHHESPDPSAVSIPLHPGCRHSIRRL